MSGSPDREKALFEEAKRLFAEGDLSRARDLFELIVLENGEYRKNAEYWLAKIAAMTAGSQGARPTRGGPPRDRSFGVPMAPPPAGRPRDDRNNPIEMSATSVDTGGDSAPVGSPPVYKNSLVAPLRRTPHMDLSPVPPVEPGARIKVLVYTDAQAFRDGESGEALVINAPAAQKSFDVNVWLTVGEPFVVEGDDTKRLVILRDQERSEPVEFTVVREDGPSPAEPVPFSAIFTYRGRACGQVVREVPLTASQSSQPSQPVEPAPEPKIEIDAMAERPDLSVVIRKRDDQHFDVFVQTPLLAEYKEGATGVWKLESLAPAFVREKMTQFTAKNATPFSRTTALLGAGMQFFEASPEIFQKVFWELIDRNLPLRTISIVTQEPSIPWELMVPTREGDEDREPLGITYLVSRWTSRENISAPQRIPIKDAFIVAPRDTRPPLASADKEATFLEREFAGQRVDPAGVEGLNTVLGQQGRTLLHFVCHGKSGQAGGQVLVLEKQEELDAGSLRALRGVKKAFKEGRPLVFLNACEVGRQEPALVGAGGFAEAFMALGASGVIAPLWSVKDSVAHEIAEKFYARVKAEPNTPFAQILADLRRQSYAENGGEDTYAAYCFYGDPLARQAAP